MQSNRTINYSFMQESERELLIAPMSRQRESCQPWWSNMTPSSLMCSACFFLDVCVCGSGSGGVCGACGTVRKEITEFTLNINK